MRRFFWLGLFFLASCCYLQAQDADSLLRKTEQSLLSYDDSLSIFHLIDSLLMLEDFSKTSQLAVRLSYNSNVLSAGRTLGIEQFGLAPGAGFYHHSGFYADVSGYWSNDFEPEYYLTILSAGYLHSFSKKFSVMAGYDRYLYNTKIDNAYISFKNALTVSPSIDLKPVSFRADYTFYFGEKKVHRVMPSITYSLQKKGLLKLDQVTFYPGVYLLFGNEKFSEITVDMPDTRAERLQNWIKYGTPYRLVEIQRSVFGLMNYAFSFPVNVQHKHWSFTFSYTYSVPRALNDEPLLLSESSFLSGGITYYFNLHKKNPLF